MRGKFQGSALTRNNTAPIDSLESGDTAFDPLFEKLIEHEALLALTDVICCDALQGIADDGSFAEPGKSC